MKRKLPAILRKDTLSLSEDEPMPLICRTRSVLAKSFNFLNNSSTSSDLQVQEDKIQTLKKQISRNDDKLKILSRKINEVENMTQVNSKNLQKLNVNNNKLLRNVLEKGIL
ncbi:Hypothetical_protein [Hexamita inflata]|uniref:Hypothetical_protein n=1 Tax=Hexamita inflata TaxID=28002 RepID=A0AA86TUR3_9EUKA|nr:Hypothetical protein HINF_LOCUS17250 [Hexamita inflata]